MHWWGAILIEQVPEHNYNRTDTIIIIIIINRQLILFIAANSIVGLAPKFYCVRMRKMLYWDCPPNSERRILGESHTSVKVAKKILHSE